MAEQTMVERVAKALHASLGYEAQWPSPECTQCIDAARAAIEAMRAVPEICYDQYRCDKMWRDLNSIDVWNLWIDAALAP